MKAPRRSALTCPRGMAATGNSLTATGSPLSRASLLGQTDLGKWRSNEECCRIISASFEIVATIACKVVEDDAEVIE